MKINRAVENGNKDKKRKEKKRHTHTKEIVALRNCFLTAVRTHDRAQCLQIKRISRMICNVNFLKVV